MGISRIFAAVVTGDTLLLTAMPINLEGIFWHFRRVVLFGSERLGELASVLGRISCV